MAELDDIYNSRLLEIAAAIPEARRLSKPDASASARAKLCGSTIVVDVDIEDGRFSDFGQEVHACLLGQAAAAIVAREIVGATPEEFHGVAATMRAMLKEGGPPPTGRWADLGLLAAVKDYPHRHASTLLVFDAVEKALDEIAGAEAGSTGAAAN
jgi:NifU-like protein involved in Fe-S cluster formation